MQGILAPLTTPFDDDENVDIAAFEKNLGVYEKHDLTGYLINGSSAESVALDVPEKLELLLASRRVTQKPLLVGVSAESTRQTLKAIEKAAALDVSGVLVRTPSYFGGQLDQVEYFSELAKHSELPIYIYQIPQYTGVKLSSSQLIPLARLSRIAGIKDSAGDLQMLTETLEDVPEGFDYLLGAAGLLLPALELGASGGILALANVLPAECCRLFELARAGKKEEARRLQRALIPVNRLIGGSNGFGLAGLKFAMQCRGFTGGRPRRPVRALSDEGRRALEQALSSFS